MEENHGEYRAPETQLIFYHRYPPPALSLMKERTLPIGRSFSVLPLLQSEIRPFGRWTFIDVFHLSC
jgi:hypothetical protein